MNSLTLAGLVNNPGLPGLAGSLEKPEQRSRGNDFLSLLENRMFMSFDQNSTSSNISNASGFAAAKPDNSRLENGFRPLNVWERPLIKERSEARPVDNAGAKGKCRDCEEKKASSTEKNPANEAQADVKEAVSQDSGNSSEISSISLSEAEKETLLDMLSELSEEEVSVMAASPETFINDLIKAVEELPDSEEKAELLQMLNSEDFAAMVEQLAATVNNAGMAESANESLLADSEQNYSETLSHEGKKEKSVKAANVNANETGDSENAQTDADTQQTQATEALTEATSEKASKKASEKDYRQQEKAEPLNGKKNAGAEIEQPKESLRAEFKREHQDSSSEVSTAQTLPEESPETTQNRNEVQGFRMHEVQVAEKPVTASEVAGRLVNSLMKNNQTEASARQPSFTYNPASVSNQKTSNFQNNAGNGFSNGFSSNSSAGSETISRPVQANNQNVFLSQLLEKAEMFKSSDGKKVLSVEMDPKELGKMEMELTSRDGTVTAKISAESELAKAKLEELAPQIKEHLFEQGINLTEITVDISSRHPDERNNQQMSEGKNKSSRPEKVSSNEGEAIIRKNVLPNLRKVALNIQSVDLTI